MQPPVVWMGSFWTEVEYVLYHFCAGEVWFYIVHRILHTPRFYKYHKTHHENSETVGAMALYAHPFETIVLNLGSFVALHYVVVFSVFHVYLIVTLAIINTIAHSHTGRLHGFHQEHHRRVTCNFGFDYFMDRLCATRQS
jgi:methylsterol monooxygenase